jgi:signal transduction histidine kinase
VELTEALDTTERLFEAVRALEVRPKPKPDEFVDLSEVLRVALRAVQLDIRTNANFEFDMQPVGLVQGSASQLSQVVVCLLLNALHAMAGQPRSLSNLSVRLMQAGSDVCLEVADSGPAIPPEALPKVFEPLAGGLRNKTSGIGLAIARAIVEELNGKIEVENRLGGGVCFTVRFPGHEASYKPPASTLPSPKMARSAS